MARLLSSYFVAAAVLASVSSFAAVKPPVASYGEAADLYRGAGVPSLDDIRGWWAGVLYYDDQPNLPIASAFASSLDGQSDPLRAILATFSEAPSDYFYVLDAAKIDRMQRHIQKKSAIHSTAKFEGSPSQLVSYYSGSGYSFKNAVRKTLDGKLVVASYYVTSNRLGSVGVYEKKVYPASGQTAIVGVIDFKGGFAKDVQVPVADKRPMTSFRLLVPQAAAIELLEASVKVAGSLQPLTLKAGATSVTLPSPAVVDAVVVTLNGRVGEAWQVPVSASFVAAEE